MGKKSLFTILAVMALLGGVIFFFQPKNQQLLSPGIGGEILATNLWQPQNGPVDSNDAPVITARAAYFVDTGSGEVLYQKNPHQRLPIASLTKIMTAIVTLENKDLNGEVEISQKAASMEPDHMELKAGERLTVEELMYGIFLVSANDAAEALAETSAKNRGDFIGQMNNTAQRIGMKDTLFINPTGLEEDQGEQYSTAYDVAIMSRYATRRFPRLVDFSKTPRVTLPQTSTHQDYDLYSGINLLTTYPGVVGLKTGYTPEAGLTLATLARKEGHEVLGILLGSENRREEARELLDYSFKKLNIL